MPRGIIIFGANGSGKSTIAAKVAMQLNFKHMDIEDYHFIPSTIPYTKSRSRDECLSLMLEDMEKYNNFVLSAVKGDFGHEIESMYKMAVHLEAPKETRVLRVKERSHLKHGERVISGGDMYEQQLEFVEFVKNRSLERIEQWEARLKCPVIRVDTTQPINDSIEEIIKAYKAI